MSLASNDIICQPINDTHKRYLLGKSGSKSLLAIGLNPSTANEKSLDPTSRNIERLAINHGYDSWYLVNLYALRTSKPYNLPQLADKNLMKSNYSFISDMILSNEYNIDGALLCWGNMVDEHQYLKQSAEQLITIMEYNNVPLYCMHITQSGNPYHPAPTPVNRFLGGINNVKLHRYDVKNKIGHYEQL